jgi:hypothetical protein
MSVWFNSCECSNTGLILTNALLARFDWGRTGDDFECECGGLICRMEADPPKVELSTDEDCPAGLTEIEREHEVEAVETKPEIDIQTDPSQASSPVQPDQNWEAMIRSIEVRKPNPPNPEEQRK